MTRTYNLPAPPAPPASGGHCRIEAETAENAGYKCPTIDFRRGGRYLHTPHFRVCHMDNRDKMLQELAAAAAHHQRTFAAAAAPIDPAHVAKALTWPIGTRVLDLVTGVKGVVVNGRRENVLLSSAGVDGR